MSMSAMNFRGIAAVWVLFSILAMAQQSTPAPAATSTQPPAAAPAPAVATSPDVLPGNGLAQHDFFYTGEAKDERMFIVRKGQVVWSYTHDGKGEISDATLLSNGSVLFAHQFGITEITADKKVVWDYPAPPNTEIHTAQPIGKDRVVFIENGAPAQLLVVNKVTGKTELSFVLPVKDPQSIHGQFRHARLTDAGTILVAQKDLGKVCEYDTTGKELWSVEVPGIWSVEPLKNGNILVSSNHNFVREINRKGETVWEFAATDAPGYTFSNFQIATRLTNGNTLVNDWFNQWHGTVDPAHPPVQAIEITPDKKIVWGLRSWAPPAELGPATTIQILDEPSAPENVSFGEFH
jgi:outer membrane protein assembly factor BamB